MANRYQNDYNDQDYPHYYDRNDRYDSQSERGNSDRSRREQRDRFGSGRENTQGGSSDYNQSGKNLGNDYARGYDSSNRANDDFASTNRHSNYQSDSRRGRRDERGDYTLYGYDRDQRSVDRSGDFGNQSERSDDYSSNYNYSGGSYARSDDDRQPTDGRGGGSRYRGEQGNQSDFGQQSSRQHFYGQSGGYTGDSEKGYDYNRREGNRNENRFRPRSNQEERGWWERTTDEVASWFGDDEATRRRESDSSEYGYGQHPNRGQGGQQASSHRGRGPKNYRRTDDRIKEDINDRLTDYAYLDASDIDVDVAGGEVTLTGTVESRYAKRMAEDIAENVSGVNHLENRLRVKNQSLSDEHSPQNQAGFSSSNASDSSGTYGSREDLAANYSNLGLTEVSPIGKPATGDLTGSNTEAMAASATSSISSDKNEMEESDKSEEFDSSATFSQRGVDKLSDSPK